MLGKDTIVNLDKYESLKELLTYMKDHKEIFDYLKEYGLDLMSSIENELVSMDILLAEQVINETKQEAPNGKALP
jgi:flagellar biosynthesis/type III secretory pathway protein FliH